MSERPEILIAGAGPTGLTLAVFLAQAGVPFRIVDPKPGPTDETRAVGIQARTLELFRLVGVTDRLLEQGLIVDRLVFWVRGKPRVRAHVAAFGAGLSEFPYVFNLGQDQTERLLNERLEELGGKVEWNRRVESLRQTQACVVTEFEDGTSEQFRFVCGCDGGRSAVRGLIGLGFPGGTYSHRFFVADVHARGDIEAGELNVTLFDNDFMAFFPLKEKDRYRLIGTVPAGIDPEHATIEQIAPHAATLMKGEVKDTRWFSIYNVHHRVASRFQVGRVFLLGDAGHVHSPVGAQGMNTGIGDAVNLAWKLENVVLYAAEEALLNTYAQERMPFAQSLVKTTDRVFELVVRSSPLARFSRLQVFPSLLRFLIKMRGFQLFLFRTVSQIKVNYRDSRLSQGRFGRIQAGERLPYVPRVYEAIREGRWHVLCFNTDFAPINGFKVIRFELTADLRKAGYAKGVCILRPDSYVGFAGRNPTLEEARAYVRLVFGPARPDSP